MSREEFIIKINAAGLGGKGFVKPNNYAGGPYFYGCFLMVINGLHMKTMKEENMKI